MRPLNFHLLLPSLLVGLSLPAQTPPPGGPAQAGTTPTIRAQAKLVVVDVVVTDKEHHAIHNLKQQDFSLLENNAPQTVRSFEEHTAHSATEAAKYPPLPPQPPGIFTNYVAAPLNSAVNVLLLDTLNTPLTDQQFVRQQVLAYLKSARPGSNIAIFGLTSRLLMLQGFTSNPEILKAVINKQGGKASPLLDDTVGGGGMPDTVADQNAASGNIMPPEIAANMQTFMNVQQSFQLQLRARYTLDAMSLLARYLSGIPGRKNLIWFSGSFPLSVDPDTTGESSDPFAGVADSEREYRDTINLLARSQVAIYPVDARGLMTLPMFSAASDGSKYARNPGAMTRDSNTFFQNTANEHSTMLRMAADTGGRAFVNTNGLTQAVASAIDEGSNYYTLTYTPTNSRWQGEFRKIAVKLSQSGYQLAYRSGYYADDPASPTSAVTLTSAATPSSPGIAAAAPGLPPVDPALIQKAMSHGVPGPTQILYKVRILPAASSNEDAVATNNILSSTSKAAKAPFRRYAVDFAAVTGDFAWQIAKDGVHHGDLQFVTLVYTPEGEVVNTAINTVNANVTADRFAILQRIGIPFHQEISVPAKGDFSIRTGVIDLSDAHMGAAEVPVAVVKNLPPAPAPPAPPAAQTPRPPPASTPSTPPSPSHP